MTSLGFPMASSYVSIITPVRSFFESLRGPNPLLWGHQDLLSDVPGGRLFERSSIVNNSFHVLILVVFSYHSNPEHADSPSRHSRWPKFALRLSFGTVICRRSTVLIRLEPFSAWPSPASVCQDRGCGGWFEPHARDRTAC